MSDQPRAVWLTHGDVSWLHTSADTPQRREALMRLNIGFNKSPADPVETVGAILEAEFQVEITDEHLAVLAALGLPKQEAPE